jgi:outer membrane protein insertion porin family
VKNSIPAKAQRTPGTAKNLFAFLCFFCAFAVSSKPQDDPVQIASITFEGNRSMDTRQLKSFLRLSVEGTLYVPGNLQGELSQVARAYQDGGFLKVQVSPPSVQVKTVGGRKFADIRITVVEGPRYTTGDVTIKSAGALAPEALRQLCPMAKGQPYSRIKAAQWQEKVEDSYRTLGYLRSHCPVRETVNEAGKTVSCVLECVEGKLYVVGRIHITGDSSINPGEFKRRLLFSEGGVFNPEMIALSLQYLNQSQIYKPISNNDIDVSIDDESSSVTVSLRVFGIRR